MKVINQTKQTTFAKKIVIPTSLLDQSLGLLRYKTPVAIFLKTRFGIHTFAMRYPIDVLILDKLNRVVSMKQSMKPNNIFIWDIKHDTVLEFPSGLIKKTKTMLKDTIIFK